MTTIFSLDTTSKHASLAVAGDGNIQTEFNYVSRDDLSATLIPAIAGLLNSGSAAIELSHIDVFAIAVGPGFFTGIRVGLAALKGLLLGQEKPVVPVVTLEALAYKCREPGFTTISLIDARREEVYLAGYDFLENKAGEVIPPALLHISQLKERLSHHKHLCFVGSGAEVHEAFIRENFSGAKIGRRSFFLAPEIAEIAYDRYKEKDYIADLQQLMPFYLRKPDAEQNLAK